MRIAAIVILWLIFGSLGSVVMTRFADGVTQAKLRGFFFWYSQCPQCKHRLKAIDLIPVVSYLVQWGKCRYCWKKISRIYPVSEVLCAGIFVLTYFFLKDFWTTTLIFWLLTNRLLILLLIYDLQTYELHMIAWILLMIVWILANVFAPGWNIRFAFLSALLFSGIFLCIYLFAKRYAKLRFKKDMEWFGEGDIYLAAGIWILVPIVLSFHNIPLFSWWMIINVLLLFIVLSSILGLIRSGFQYIWNLKFTIWNLQFGNRSTTFENSELWILHSTLHIIPFFPAMIIAFRLIVWKAPYFISLFF